MSLAAAVLRHVTVLALTDKTIAGKEVQSSSLIPIGEAEKPEPVPVVAIFTDAMKAGREDIQGREIIGANAAVTLALEIACVGKAADKDGKGAPIFIPETDEGMELTIDLIQRQAICELQTSQAIWPRLWRDMVPMVVGLSWQRGVAIERGMRFAARRFEMDCKLISDPIPGRPLSEVWVAVLEAMTAEPRTRDLAATLRAFAEGTAIPAWRGEQAVYGLSDLAIRALGIGPITGAENASGLIPTTAKLTVDDKDLEVEITEPAGE